MAFENGQLLGRPPCMRLTFQRATVPERDIIDLMTTGLFRRGQDGDAAPLSNVFNRWHFCGLQNVDPVLVTALVHQPGKIDIQRACQVPKRGDRRAAFTAFDLAHH